MVNLPTLNYSCGANLGGLNLIKVIPVAQVASMPEPVDNELADPIVLVPGAAAAYLVFPEGAGEFTETQAENDHGTFYKQKVSVFVPKDSPAAVQWATRVATFKWCILEYLDNNGLAKVVGSLDYPLQFTADLETGRKSNSTNGHTFTFTGESTHKAYLNKLFSSDYPGNDQGGGSGEPVQILDGAGNILATVQPGGTFEITSGFSFGFRIL